MISMAAQKAGAAQKAAKLRWQIYRPSPSFTKVEK
jgi:hypothetical protein